MHDSIQKWQQKNAGIRCEGYAFSQFSFRCIADYTTMGKCYEIQYECEI